MYGLKRDVAAGSFTNSAVFKLNDQNTVSQSVINTILWVCCDPILLSIVLCCVQDGSVTPHSFVKAHTGVVLFLCVMQQARA